MEKRIGNKDKFPTSSFKITASVSD
uniref:Uncharacterized protein n=1 Tax=Rhizophora mucronata TaxID=61149 RepID=A0A2P2PNF6_RHIMU